MERVSGSKILIKSITERKKNGIIHFISEKEKAPLPKSGIVIGVGKDVTSVELNDTVYFEYKNTKDIRSGFLILDEKSVKLVWRE